MAATTTVKLPPQYHLRPGRRSDLAPATHIYQAAFDPDMLPDILFPSRHEHPQDFLAFLSRLFDDRYWSPQWILTVICGSSGSSDGGGNDAPVGFTWWKRPLSELSIWERWLSPYAILSAFVRRYHKIRNWLLPIPTQDKRCTAVFERVCAQVFPTILVTPRRKEAWYLSTLAVDPKLHGLGLGSALLRDGLAKVEKRGLAAWLIGVVGTDKYYSRFGFGRVGAVNVGELSHWDGGFVMFKE